MTRIGMALDPSGLKRIPRRRRRAVAQVVIALVAVAELATAGFLISQRSVSTIVAVDDLLAEVRDEAPTGSASEVIPSADAEVAGPPDAVVVTDAAGDQVTPTEAGSPENDSSTATTPGSGSSSAGGPATKPQASQPAPEPGGATSAAAFALPRTGVYTYATEGYEKISLGGARHDYPERTHAIVKHDGGCDWSFDHRVVEEKRSVNTYCNQGPVQQARAYDGYVTFYGSTSEAHYTCDGGTRSDLRDRPGDAHDVSCSDGEGTSRDRVTFVGIERLVIGGKSVDALRYHIDTTISGNVVGTSTQEVWVHPHDAMLLRLERDTETEAYEFGAQVEYVEHAVFTLESLTPQR